MKRLRSQSSGTLSRFGLSMVSHLSSPYHANDSQILSEPTSRPRTLRPFRLTMLNDPLPRSSGLSPTAARADQLCPSCTSNARLSTCTVPLRPRFAEHPASQSRLSTSDSKMRLRRCRLPLNKVPASLLSVLLRKGHRSMDREAISLPQRRLSMVCRSASRSPASSAWHSGGLWIGSGVKARERRSTTTKALCGFHQ